MIDVPFTPDEIGPWSEIKLEIIQKYGPAYTTVLSSERARQLKRYYIDGFSGAGVHVSKKPAA
jgi:three-Cys-motif partner protein